MAAFSHRIAIYEESTGGEAEQLLSAGADDIISFPLNAGKVLTRLRNGVRRLEFERRLGHVVARDPFTGHYLKNGFIQRLEQLLQPGKSIPPSSLVTCGIDYLGIIRDQHGQRAVQNLNAALARCLTKLLSRDDICGVLEEGVFAVFLAGRSAEEAQQFAQDVADAFPGRDTLMREIKSRPSVSAAVFEYRPEQAPAELIDEASDTFAHVRAYGGNRVIDASEVQREIAEWRQAMDDGTPFQEVVAQDVMEAFPMILPQHNFQSLPLGEALSSAASDRPLPPCLPVVDQQGHLLGAVHPAECAQVGTWQNGHLAELITPEPAVVDFNQPLSQLFETLQSVESGLVIVVQDERPVGYITREGLASLIVDPINAWSYYQELSDEPKLAEFVVPVEVHEAENDTSSVG